MTGTRRWVWAYVDGAWRPAVLVRRVERGRRKGSYWVETEELRGGAWTRKSYVVSPDAVREDLPVVTKHRA